MFMRSFLPFPQKLPILPPFEMTQMTRSLFKAVGEEKHGVPFCVTEISKCLHFVETLLGTFISPDEEHSLPSFKGV